MRREDAWPLGALGLILAISASWWGFALWSIPGAPSWVERARAVCFNITESGLPDTKGWLLLLGQPPIMVALLLVGWREPVVRSVRRLLSSGPGRAAAGAALGLVLYAVGMAAARVADARLPEVTWHEAGQAPADHPRLDRSWPEVEGLVDQEGRSFSHASLAGRSALVTFAFGHCETLCPLVVEQTRAARAILERGKERPDQEEISLVVLTLDPWRDRPSMLASLRARWRLDPGRDFVVGGSVDVVEAALDAWGISRARNTRSGDVVHAAVVYLVEGDGTVAFASAGGVEHLASLGRRLRPQPPP